MRTTFHILTIITLMSLVALYLKYYFKFEWSDYQSPVSFHKQIILKKIKMGIVSEETAGRSYLVPRFSYLQVLMNKDFLFEALLLLLEPSILGRIFDGE
jgi:hypothetical protein